MSNRIEPNSKPDYEKMALIGKMNEMIGENLKLRAMVIELQEKVKCLDTECNLTGRQDTADSSAEASTL